MAHEHITERDERGGIAERAAAKGIRELPFRRCSRRAHFSELGSRPHPKNAVAVPDELVGEEPPLGEWNTSDATARERMECDARAWAEQPVEGCPQWLERGCVEPIVPARRHSERTSDFTKLGYHGATAILLWKVCRQPSLVSLTAPANARGNSRQCERYRHTPLRRRQDGEVVAAAPDLEERAKECDAAPLARSWCAIPERIRCNHSRDPWNERGHGGGVRLAPDVERRTGKPLSQRRGQRRRKDEIPDVIEADEQDARWFPDMASRCESR